MKRPAYQWYPADAESDEVFRLMTYEQEGVYRRLLDHQWIEGSIPADPQTLAGLLPKMPREKFIEIWPLISGKFRPRGTDRLVNDKLESQRRELDRYVKVQRAKSRKGVEARKLQTKNSQPAGQPTGQPVVLPEPPRGLTSSSSTSSSPKNIQTESDPPLDLAWETFCRTYPQDRVERGRIVQDGFIGACLEVGVASVMQRLAAHKRSAQWRKGMVPKMGNYFGDKQLWRQELPEIEMVPGAKPAADITAMALERIKADEARYGKRR